MLLIILDNFEMQKRLKGKKKKIIYIPIAQSYHYSHLACFLPFHLFFSLYTFKKQCHIA